MTNVVNPLPFFGGRIRELFPHAAEELNVQLLITPRTVVDFIWDWAEKTETSPKQARAQRELAWALRRAIKQQQTQ